MQDINVRGRIEAAEKLLSQQSTSIEKFQSIRTLLVGINPVLDKKLTEFSKHLSTFQKLYQGDLIELSAENLPVKTERDKKKKKALLILIRSHKNLKSEVMRVETELSHHSKDEPKTRVEQMTSIAKIVRFAKGPMGIITFVALVLVGANMMMSQKQTGTTKTKSISISTSKMQVIVFNGNKIPLSQLRVGRGPECKTGDAEVDHYHALEGNAVSTIDGKEILDPGGCGFGKVDDTPIIEAQ